MPFDRELCKKAESLLSRCHANRVRLATAESCTGGLISGLLTAVSGSSAVIDRGFVTYSNEAKQAMLGIGADMLADHGAVSEEVAAAMACGALANSLADFAVAVTGIAGPGGATETKPVGLVYLSIAQKEESGLPATWKTERHVFSGDRSAVRLSTVLRAIELLSEATTA